MRRPAWAALICAVVLVPGRVHAQIDFSAQMDLASTITRDSLGINTAFRGDNPFNPVRLRLFARSWVTDRIGVFAELLYDAESDPRVNGAYMVINELGGAAWLNARIGLAPSLLGSFGLRSTYFNSNPVIGVPLIWQYRTNVQSNGQSTVASLTGTAGEPGRGAPMLYDACWNIQWELLGEAGPFEYSVGVTPGSQSNPKFSRYVDGSQWLARLGVSLLPGLRLGVSGAHGPWLSAPVPAPDGSLPYVQDPSDFDQSLLGLDIEYIGGPFVFHSEVFRGSWETPLVDDALGSTGGYAELRYDVGPGWYLAGRMGALQFDDIVTDATAGTTVPWDRDTYRSEIALGHRVSRQVLMKFDWQRTWWDGFTPTQNLFTVQLTTAF